MSNPEDLYFVVDDDPSITLMVESLLTENGLQVEVCNDSTQAFNKIINSKPHCIILDIMMPGIDGLELCRQLREQPSLANTCIIMFSAKSYELDRKKAYEFGANGYIQKPLNIDNFASEVKRIVDDEVTLDFWGVRGTLPVPGENSLRYGGNTSCVTLKFGKERMFIFDAGTGIKVLSDHILNTYKGKITGKIFISHSHWDHINALPFFAPLYIPGNEFEICGPAQGNVSVMDMVSAQMDDVYFPITIKEFGARVYFRDLHEDSHEIDGIEIKTMMLSHPGYCLGYRINYNGRSICYITDNEMFPEDNAYHDGAYNKKLEDFVRNADALITDSTYFDEEYTRRIGWGHSCLSEVTRLAHNANVKTLYLFHHDPDQTDDDIDNKLETVSNALRELNSDTICMAPRENQSVLL